MSERPARLTTAIVVGTRTTATRAMAKTTNLGGAGRRRGEGVGPKSIRVSGDVFIASRSRLPGPQQLHQGPPLGDPRFT
jgi:hypothetical protein